MAKIFNSRYGVNNDINDKSLAHGHITDVSFKKGDFSLDDLADIEEYLENDDNALIRYHYRKTMPKVHMNVNDSEFFDDEENNDTDEDDLDNIPSHEDLMEDFDDATEKSLGLQFDDLEDL